MDTTAGLWRTMGASQAFGLLDLPAFEAHLTPTGWLVLTGEPLADLNTGMIDDGPDPEGQLREFGGVLRRRGLPALIFLGEGVADRLAGPAAELGLQPGGRVPLMAYRPEGAGAVSPAPDRYRVEPVGDPAALAEVNGLSVGAFGLPADVVARVMTPSVLGTPGLMVFLAREDGEPVSTVMTQRVGLTVGVWSMATRPDRQRRGAGRAVLLHALAHHRAQGAELFYLIATEAGRPLYEAVGFRTLAEPAVWVLGHSVQVPTP